MCVSWERDVTNRCNTILVQEKVSIDYHGRGHYNYPSKAFPDLL